MSLRKEWLEKNNNISKSKVFLFPMLQIPLYHVNDKINYLLDVTFVQMGFPQIVLTFNNIDDIPLKEDLYRLSVHHCYVDSEYGDEDKELNMFFDVPREFKKDFELFTQGCYSKFSDEFKHLLVKYHGTARNKGISPKTGLPNVNIYDVIHPTDELKKLMAKQLSTDNAVIDWKMITEVLDPPNIDVESFKTIEELI